MRRLFMNALTALWVLGCAGSLAAQTAEDVIEKHLAAIGGREALTKLTSRIAKGTITFTTGSGEVKGSMEIYAKRPNKTRSHMKLDLTSMGGGELIVDQRFDGSAGYYINSMEGNREISGDQLDNLRNARFPTMLLTAKEDGTRLELLGKEKIADREVHVLLVSPKTGAPAKHFIDAQTYELVKMSLKVNIPQMGEVEQNTAFADFKDADGFKIPFKITVTSSAQTFSIQINKVEHNAPIEDSMFSKPAETK